MGSNLKLHAMRFISAPELATNEATLKARIFHRVLWMTIGIAVFFLGGLVALQPNTLMRRAESVAVLLILGLVLLAANRRGWTKLASWGLVAGLTGLISLRAYTS